MKQVTTNELQGQLSKIIREVEQGEVFEVKRYSKSVAYLVSKKDYEKFVTGSECKACMRDLRNIAKKIKS